ncbi:acetyl-CoA carboxylase biotin carboxyl carrier protein subunit [Saccharopolyspora sp. WRP15-2]|uniref:Biotin carboxyl carrier protein of acetyl-CoA carboxylase n=1 Tax=Saccharopolyspora oryzae TaxID=2997343 RepID=A0ABT4UUI3_9PSEU|nr:biotin/lipoyl-containing protein [Saccharopolyspora oryzae]MDA3624707.1 acetyl-CoA carboxylase biotin carboxyl carrier protein subunit [Saccharopolyspora oryzae]
MAEKTAPEHELGAVLTTIEQHVTRMLTGLPNSPTALRVRFGDVAVETEWTAPVAAAPPPAAPVRPTDEPADDRSLHVRAPSVGVFYRAPEPGAEPFVSEGDVIRPGQQVAIVEAMKLMIPVKSEVHGEVVAVLKANGDPVEYDEPLLAVVPVD